MTRYLLSFFVLVFSTAAFAQDFSAFQKILDQHWVDLSNKAQGYQTAFDYDNAKKNTTTMTLLGEQSLILQKFDPKTLQNKTQALAFWINSYNFFMIKIILVQGYENGKRTIDSVKDLGSFFSPYKIFKREINNIGGTNYSLDHIEKGILLGLAYQKRGWKDARIHFAVNCASVGCPPLHAKVYQADTLDKVLDENISKAMKTSRQFHWQAKTLYLTHLFKWYKKDFEQQSGSILKFITSYLSSPEEKEKLKNSKKINYIEYNWKLNRPKNF